MPTTIIKPSTPGDAELLKLFQAKRYMGDQTVVLDLFGHASLLDNAEHVYFMQPDQHLLLRPEDFNDKATLETRLNQFSQRVNSAWEKMTEQTAGQFIEQNKKLAENDQNNEIVLKNLKSLSKETKKACKKHLKELQKNPTLFKSTLKKTLEKRYKGKLSERLGKKSAIATLKAKLPTITKSMSKDVAFIDKEALRLIENKDTRKVVEHALRAGPQEIFCTERSQRKLSNPRGNLRDATGHSIPNQKRIIITSDSNSHIESPSLSPLGGLGTAGTTTACAQAGKLRGFNNVLTPVARLLAEEFHDYLKSPSTNRDASDAKKIIDDSRRTAAEGLASLFRNLGSDEPSEKLNAITSKLSSTIAQLKERTGKIKEANAKNKETIKPTLDNARKLSGIARKVINKEKRSKEEDALWKKMRSLARKVEKQSGQKKPGYFLLSQTKEWSVGTSQVVPVNDVKMNLKLVETNVQEPGCNIPQGETINRWEVTPNNPWTDEQKASLYVWMSDELEKINTSTQTSYPEVKHGSEFLGKVFGYYLFFPGYIETFLPEVHQALQKHAEQLAVPDGSCSGEDCTDQCKSTPETTGDFSIAFPPQIAPISPKNATAESTTFNATLSPAEALEQTAIHLAQNASGNIMLFKLGAYLFKNIRASVQSYFSATKETLLSDDDAAMRFQAMDEHLVYTTNRLSALKAKYPKKNWGEKTRELESCCRRLRLLDRNNPTEEKFTPLEERIGNLQRGLLPVAKGKKSTHRQAACPSEPYKTSSSAVFFAEVPKALAPTNSSQLLEVR